MKTEFVSTARRWAAALGLAAAVTLPTLSAEAVAAPFAPLPQASVPAAPEAGVTQVRDRWDGRRDWRRGGWDRGRDRGRYYRHRRNNNGLALGLGIGLPLAAYLATRPAYNYAPYGYDDGYYVRPAPRRVYRSYGGNRHTSWCYNRYRSYRAYDNTFQPYNGPRQLCYSPYS